MIAKNNFLDYIINSKKNSNIVNLEKEVKAPWVGTTNEEEAKKLILSLSENRKLFLRKPPEGVFEFNLDENLPIAKMLLEEDIRLQKLRFELVPKCIKEDEFWRNYFYRINLIKKSFSMSHSKLKTESANSEGCLAQENPKKLVKNANDEIHDYSDKDNMEQMNMKIENSFEGKEEKPQKDDSFENILETEIEELNSFIYSDDTGEKIENSDWEKELEEILEESAEYN
ncbi:Synapse-associated protein 1 like protein [Argiope bruennichi]|uniref:Synapse-associated protein 1 like protein n=1 Tax=Argiope bruennichi TaxID=94029 RepID=A0A8T0G118_ARGBR|nr:Synapse-associated protein 1 like protein [Argiope bruennichi]